MDRTVSSTTPHPASLSPEEPDPLWLAGLVTFSLRRSIPRVAVVLAIPTIPDGTRVSNSGSFKASVPFVGGKVERVAADQTERYLAKEVTVGSEWLAR
jgi:hypothetical protein